MVFFSLFGVHSTSPVVSGGLYPAAKVHHVPIGLVTINCLDSYVVYSLSLATRSYENNCPIDFLLIGH